MMASSSSRAIASGQNAAPWAWIAAGSVGGASAGAWIVIDAVSIWLYLDRGLESTALLFVAYVVLAVLGYFSWKKRLAQAPSA